MIQNPVIFLTFANQVQVPDRYLPMLIKEEEELLKNLNKLSQRNITKILNLGHVKTKQLYHQIVDWEGEDHNLVMLHYGGHAKHDLLELVDKNGNSHPADASGLAKLLGSQPNLQLVFLNGCATNAQVKALLQQGVRAVIATTTAVNDRMAADFAIQFYQAISRSIPIGKAFERASNFIETEYQFRKSKIYPRSLEFEEEDLEDEQIYGLYYREDSKDVLNFSFGKPPKKAESLGKAHKYLCDRVDQTHVFHEKFLNFGEGPFFFCAIHGPRKQSHQGLFKRIDYEYITSNEESEIQAKYIVLAEKNSLEDYKKGILIHLFREFGFKKLPLSKMTIEKLAEIIQVRGQTQFAIHFQVKSTRWKPFTKELFDWFMNQFCNKEKIAHFGVRFYFFINIIYEEMEDNRKWWDKIRGRDLPHVELSTKIRGVLNQLKILQYACLPELNSVPYSHIDDWMRFVAETDTEKEKWLTNYFPERAASYDMEDVESRLDKIINKYNQIYLKA